MRSSYRFLLLAGYAALSTNDGAAQQFYFQGLGDLPGKGFWSRAEGVSADGMVVVGQSSSINGTEAFRWTKELSMLPLGDLPGGLFHSQARATSSTGEAVVGVSRSAKGDEAFRWTQTAGMVGLGDLPGTYFTSHGRGVSADGAVVVGRASPGEGSEAFRWTEASAMVGLGDLPGGTSESYAYGESADGSVVIGYSSGANGYEAFRWTEASAMVGLGDLPGGPTQSRALAVSADGLVTVGWGFSFWGREAFSWTEESGMVGLGDLEGGRFASEAVSVSGDGSVIGGWSGGYNGNEAVLWDAERVMRPVILELIERGIDVPVGWSLELVSGVSLVDGILTIVGYGRSPLGTEGWVAVMPWPVQVLPSSFSVLRGLRIGGGLADLFESDDQYLLIRPWFVLTTTEAPVQVLVEGASPYDTVSELRFVLEAGVSFPNIRQSIDLFNFQTNQWELVDARPGTVGDTVVEVTVSMDPSRFVQPGTGLVRARLRWKESGPILAYPWLARIDQVGWTVMR